MTKPETSHESKQVMIRAEHKDTIHVETLGECVVVQRMDTYYGPKLRIEPEDGDEQYLLTAPGPKFELQLWENDRENFEWRATAEVVAELVDTEQYEICDVCGEAVKTAQHRRRRAIGTCSGGIHAE